METPTVNEVDLEAWKEQRQEKKKDDEKEDEVKREEELTKKEEETEEKEIEMQGDGRDSREESVEREGTGEEGREQEGKERMVGERSEEAETKTEGRKEEDKEERDPRGGEAEGRGEVTESGGGRKEVLEESLTKTGRLLRLGSKSYRLTRMLGQGSFASVFKAVCLETNQVKAIKEIRKKTIPPKCLPQLKLEFEALQQLNQHPHVIRTEEIFDASSSSTSPTAFSLIYSSSSPSSSLRSPSSPLKGVSSPSPLTDEDLTYIIMEYCDSGNLLEHLQSTGAMSEDLTRHYFVQIASAVDYAHKQGWTHRDLKLENILLVNPTPTPPRPPPSSPRSPSTPSPLSSHFTPSLDSAISSMSDPSSPSSPSSSSPSSSPVSDSIPLTSPPASPPSITSPISSGLKSLSPSPALPTSLEEHLSSLTPNSSYLSSSASPSAPSPSLSSQLPPSSLVSPFLNPKPPKKLDVRLADWGFSQRWKSGKYLKDSCGSIHYAAPEICFGTKYVGPEVDIWSLGVILYTMAAGYLPFNAQRVEDVIPLIKAGKVRIPPSFSPPLRDLVTRILVTNSTYRCTMDMMKLHPWFEGKVFPSTPSPPSSPPTSPFSSASSPKKNVGSWSSNLLPSPLKRLNFFGKRRDRSSSVSSSSPSPSPPSRSLALPPATPAEGEATTGSGGKKFLRRSSSSGKTASLASSSSSSTSSSTPPSSTSHSQKGELPIVSLPPVTRQRSSSE